MTPFERSLPGHSGFSLPFSPHFTRSVYFLQHNHRGTIRKGLHELEQGIVCLDAFSSRGRKRSEEHLPNLFTDITTIVDGQSQADPQFRTNRLYTRLTATEVRRQLIAQKGYREDELPTAETISTKLNELGYYPKRVAKSQPQKNCPKPTRSSAK